MTNSGRIDYKVEERPKEDLSTLYTISIKDCMNPNWKKNLLCTTLWFSKDFYIIILIEGTESAELFDSDPCSLYSLKRAILLSGDMFK